MRFFLLLSSLTLANSKYAKNQLERFWIDSTSILENLDDYDAIWIKPHGCVWSECAVDDTDDGYMGDNRDGDEQWYQYRTQSFCANTGFSLYGRKRGGLGFNTGCSKKHFINSFFTYGGADNLLLAAGIEPEVYYDGSNYGNNNNNGDDYAYNAVSYTNAQCVMMEADGDEEEDEHQSGDRKLSGSQDDGWASTLGCSADGDYVVALFEANNCDGNYFSQVLDTFASYNRQHKHVGCHRIWKHGHNEAEDLVSLTYLMNNSWSCDLDLYPNGCPDPYGQKARYDFALRTVAHGGNANLAYQNMMLKQPLRFASWVCGILAAMIMSFAYFVQNRERIKAKGGKAKGYFRCLGEDSWLFLRNLGLLIKLGCAALAAKCSARVARIKKIKEKRAARRRARRRRQLEEEESVYSSEGEESPEKEYVREEDQEIDPRLMKSVSA